MTNKELTKEEINEILTLAELGDEKILELLETRPDYIDASNEFGENIFTHLVMGKQYKLSKKILDKNPSKISVFKDALTWAIQDNEYENDNMHNLLNLLDKKSQESIVLNFIATMIICNNIKAIEIVGVEKVIEKINDKENTSLDFTVFLSCNDTMLEHSLPIYREISFVEFYLKDGFRKLDKNKTRTYILLDNLKDNLSEELKTELCEVNKHCLNYFESKDLEKKLRETLASDGGTKNKSAKI